MNSDNEDDIMDPVMQCTTLPSHSSFSQQKLVSFVTEIHTTSIDFLTPKHPSDTYVFTMKMEILLEPASNKLLVGSNTLSWKPCQGDSLNLPDHRIQITMEKVMPHSTEVGFITHSHAQTTRDILIRHQRFRS
ncbi:hypothetical protein Tco_1079504 [Tanacetum coccineum]|uniref:Uncharacterized protein n=1 Tax=Tanacetum coccineum TaxID=301880 RepID=A0ABQ5HTB9_9ASTR